MTNKTILRWEGTECLRGGCRKWMKSQAEGIQNRDDYLQEAAGSIWFEIWGVVDPDTKKNQFFQANFRKKIQFFRQFHKKLWFSRQITGKCFLGNFRKKIQFSQANFQKVLIFSRNSNFFWFSKQNLPIYSYFWASYSISLQKSPLSNILPAHDNISWPVHDPPAQNQHPQDRCPCHEGMAMPGGGVKTEKTYVPFSCILFLCILLHILFYILYLCPLFATFLLSMAEGLASGRQ